ncbi:MAG: phosphoenolpyruvate--protein phosphotransferase [Clostridiales bacterium]|jgi:phosphotransferase system enzyme I (PtsI)|nr:phosphoenolpyruvate--protein phosphotransferase [Clostridiales bacterium]
MLSISGTSVFSGVAFGPLRFLKSGERKISRVKIEDVDAEIERYRQATSEAVQELAEIYEKAVADVGEVNAAIFEIHQMMLEDEDYQDSVIGIIQTQSVNAEYAVSVTAENFAQIFSSMDDAYMKGRAADVHDISERLQRLLDPDSYEPLVLKRPVIVAAADLAPSETVQLERSMILGMITAEGSTSSHTAILARTLGIPAAIGAGPAVNASLDGKQAILDGFTGTLYIEPDEETTALMAKKHEEDVKRRQLLETLKGKPNVTLDGKEIDVFANTGSLGGIVDVLKNDAGGIGLFRSEFLYLESSDYPTEQEQFTVYKQIAESMGGRKVVIRTLDIGADKQVAYFNLPKEDNPALGMRAIRICLTRPEIFKTQLRALFRASAFGNIAIMFPMIISVGEVEQILEIVEEVKVELREMGMPFREDLELGIMIETPAAVMMSDELGKLVDFFSIGTNDLTQYTLAIDRQNQQLSQFYRPEHPAVLRLIEIAAANARKNGIWVGICGELGANLDLTETFLRMGIDELSVSAGMILRLREKIRSLDLSK